MRIVGKILDKVRNLGRPDKQRQGIIELNVLPLPLDMQRIDPFVYTSVDMEQAISVVVLVQHSHQVQLDAALKCVHRIQGYLPNNTETIIVDNGSIFPPSKKWLDTPQSAFPISSGYGNYHVIRVGHNSGVAVGRNIGASYATNSLILFLDDDQYITKDWYKSVKKLTKKYKVGVVGSYFRSTSEDHTFCGGGGLLIPKTTFDNIGGFDEQFSPAYFEDMDLSWRLANAKVAFGKLPEKLIEHDAHSTLDDNPMNKTIYENSRSLFAAKWDRGTEPEVCEQPASPSNVPTPPKPNVSIVMPCYNYAHMLPQAIQSVQAQTYKEWELIIVDDGSVDDSVAVANQCAGQDGRIRIVRHDKNMGLSAARNTGFAHAKGQYVCLLDPDDTYHPKKLEIQTKFMDSHPLAIMGYGNVTEGKYISDRPDYDPEMLCKVNYIACQSVIIRRDYLAIVGGNDISARYAEDWEHWLRISAIAQGLVKIGQKPLYTIGTHDRQYSTMGMQHEPGIVRAYEEQAAKLGQKYLDILNTPIKVAHFAVDPTTPQAKQAIGNLVSHIPTAFVEPVIICGDNEQSAAEEAWKKYPVYTLSSPQARPDRLDVIHMHLFGNEINYLDSYLRARGDYQVVITMYGRELETAPTKARLISSGSYRKVHGEYFPLNLGPDPDQDMIRYHLVLYRAQALYHRLQRGDGIDG